MTPGEVDLDTVDRTIMVRIPPRVCDEPGPGVSVTTVRTALPWRLTALLGVVYSSATAIILTCAVVGGSAPPAWRIAVVAASTAVGQAPLLRIRVGQETRHFNLGEAAVVVGLVLLPVEWLVPVAAASVLVCHLALRIAPVKAAYNAGVSCIATAAAGVTVAACAGSHPPTVKTYLVVAGVAVLWGWWTCAAAACAASFASGSRLRPQLLHGAGMNALVILLDTLLGLSIVLLGRWSPPTLLVLPPVLLALFLAYRSNLRSIEQRDAWRQLNAAGKELADLDEQRIVRRATGRAEQLFQSDTVVLDLGPDAAPAAVLVPTPHRRRESKRRVERVDRALVGAGGPLGTLRLAFAEPVPWTDHEDQVLSAFANTVAAAIWNARLYGEARRQAEEKAHEAASDALTGLGNRRLLLERAEVALVQAEKDGASLGLLLIDLDRFKEVNDTLGHGAGDRLLRGVGERLRGSVRSGDLVVRLGGDEFAVLVGDIADAAGAERVAAQLADVLARPMAFDDMTLAVEGSVGVACFPDDGRTVDELLQRADVAMYQAKTMSTGRWQRYRPDRAGSKLDRLALAGELRGALRDGELLLHFQPELDLRTGEISRVEALVRWAHPARGLLLPDDFVPAAEQSGLVREFTRGVLDQAISSCAAWQSAGHRLGVAVNLSARNLLDPTLPGEVAQLLLRHRLSADSLTLEITETAVMADPDMADTVLAELRELGVALAVDDFGTGYSSLTLLQRFTVDEVKVDRSFVQHLLVDKNNAAIVDTTVTLAHRLGLRVVAEGVESQELLDALLRLQCDVAQGHFIGEPMAVDALTAWLEEPPTLAIAEGSLGSVVPLRPRRTPPTS